MNSKIYFDNNSTTALDPRVFKAMLADLQGPPANPSSVHSFGRAAKKLLDEARKELAAFFGARETDVTFTSGGTESMNLLLRGIGAGHIITTDIEHSSTYNTVQALSANGLKATFLKIGLEGAPSVTQVENAISTDTCAIVLSAVNGETGVKLDIHAMAAMATRRKIPLFLDAVAWVGKEPIEWPHGVAGMTVSAHKFHGPKGVGALILRPGVKLSPQITGGPQEFSRRAGTENLSGILGLSAALRIVKETQTEITQHLTDLCRHFECQLLRALPNVAVNGLGPRVANVVNLAFLGCDGETLLLHLDMQGIAASHGSACASGALEPSRVLLNMGLERKVARSSIRFSFGRFNTREEVDIALEKIVGIVRALADR